jgi:hypothetical protein
VHPLKIGEMAADRFDHRSLLANEQEAGALEHHAALLHRCLRGDEPHIDRITASQIASASAASFFWRFT